MNRRSSSPTRFSACAKRSYVSEAFPHSVHGAFLPSLKEVCLLASYHRYDLLNVFPDLLFKHNGTDIMTAALFFVCSMCGTDKEVLSLLKVVGGRVVELLFAIITEHQTREHITLACCCSAMPLLSDFLHLTHRWCWIHIAVANQLFRKSVMISCEAS